MLFDQALTRLLFVSLQHVLVGILIGNLGATRFASGPPELPEIKAVERGTVVAVAHRLGTPEQECPEWLIALPKDELPQPERLAFTPPPKGEGMFHMKCSQLPY